MLDAGQIHTQVRTLEKGDEATVRPAIHALKAHGEDEWAAAPVKAVLALVSAIQGVLRRGTKHPSIRQDAVAILGNMGARSEAAIPQIVEMLEDGMPDNIREAAAAALGKIGQEAKGAVQQRMRNALVEFWQSPSQSQKGQLQVALALCKLKCDARGVVRFLTTTMASSQDAGLRKSAVEALGWCDEGEPDVVPALLSAAVHDKDETVRLRADAGLEHLGLSRDRAIQLSARQLKDSAFAEAALRNSGAASVPALTKALTAKDAIVREKAARVLGGFGELSVKAVPVLTMTLRDKSMEVRLAAAKALWSISKSADAVVPVLVKLLDEKWPDTIDGGESRRRFLQSVLEAIGRIGPPAEAASKALVKMVKDKNRHISEAALHALTAIAPALAEKARLRP